MRAFGVAQVDLRMLVDEQRVVGRVVDDEVGHHLEAVRGGVLGEGADLVVVAAGLGVAEAGIEPEGIAHRIEAAGAAGLVDGIDVDPIEAEGGDARQLGAPGRHRADEQRKQVVDARAGGGDRPDPRLLPGAAPGRAVLRLVLGGTVLGGAILGGAVFGRDLLNRARAPGLDGLACCHDVALRTAMGKLENSSPTGSPLLPVGRQIPRL